MPNLDPCTWVQKIAAHGLKTPLFHQKRQNRCPLLGSSPSAGTMQVFVIALGFSLLPVKKGAPRREHGQSVIMIFNLWCGAG